MFESAEEQIRANASAQAIEAFKLAKVTSLSSGKAKITMYGSTEESAKIYPSLKSYTAAVGDTVILAKQGSTYVILGAVQ